MISDYDPEVEPEPKLWLEAEESERADAVLDYREANETDLSNVLLHGHFHAVVETQVAMDDEIPVAETFRRLMTDGLSRHETIHAVGWVLSQHIFDAVHNSTDGVELDMQYYEKLRKFTVAQWHEDASKSGE